MHYKGHKLWVKRSNQSVLESGSNSGAFGDPSLLRALGGSKEVLEVSMRAWRMETLKSILQEWVEDDHRKRNGQLVVWKAMKEQYDPSYDWTELGSKSIRDFDSVILKEGQKEEVLKDLRLFLSQKEWFQKTAVPYQRGYLLYGPPGTGKTSFIQSLAGKVGMNVALVSLTAGIDDDSFMNLIHNKPRNSILVMEDIDHCMINDGLGSDGEGSTKRITATGLLNALDGVFSPEGSIVFLTCNDVTKVIPALLRPGRVDLKVLLDYADKYQVKHMFKRFFGEVDFDSNRGEKLSAREVCKKKVFDKLMDEIPEGTVTPAELQNLFMSYAIQLQMTKQDSDDEIAEEKKIFEALSDAIPEFLSKVAADRQQARDHEKRKADKQTNKK
ncbi:P-loop containing nucleoside triphosphate hydrolase protein [Syncephalastrum racemosum]|uniref:P-loop containing nucleoside triphosphate hydrolase protein n=1 Tax=Syncephalastrum racemosum TaxID=13706 RepID=A0A1X2HCV2_SYNRA|nr:P-loop containing nucleoside triphosphate hydrolase protein [Syncephalastrum racemosum]